MGGVRGYQRRLGPFHSLGDYKICEDSESRSCRECKDEVLGAIRAILPFCSGQAWIQWELWKPWDSADMSSKHAGVMAFRAVSVFSSCPLGPMEWRYEMIDSARQSYILNVNMRPLRGGVLSSSPQVHKMDWVNVIVKTVFDEVQFQLTTEQGIIRVILTVLLILKNQTETVMCPPATFLMSLIDRLPGLFLRLRSKGDPPTGYWAPISSETLQISSPDWPQIFLQRVTFFPQRTSKGWVDI